MAKIPVTYSLVVALVWLGVMCPLADAFAVKRGSSTRNENALYKVSERCLQQLDDCDPYSDHCCPGMSCVNRVGGFCINGVERCFCIPDSYGRM
ncbi:hypothetical protein NP493_806g01040 [Ridgeia piscesae]|uniref:Uncharacterized protein n=1 Tax=Ridgeia piscesae TaxID=27915 RepID=A0AAD9KPT1_RIDPI|nr:hypothetical protein NP493_806g01040 [Ridgeia piscesae]